MADSGGFGVKLKIKIASTLTLIVNAPEIEFPAQEKVLADGTSHDSAGGYRVWIDTGVRELGEFKATVRWDKLQATHAAVLTTFTGTATVDMSIEDPLAQEVIAFKAHVKTIGRITDREGLYQAEITFQPSGVPTITP